MQAVALVTYIESEVVNRHFNRLRAETIGLLDVYLCVHEPTERINGGALAGNFRISALEKAGNLANRYSERMRRGGTVMPGFSDLTYMPVLLDQLSRYAYIWVIEYDVDFAGSWGDFFPPLVRRTADLLGTTLYPRSQSSDWMWWPSLETPDHVSLASHVRSFGPIVRFSRRMIDCYAKAIQDGSWRGHSEALYPTIARHYGPA